MRKIISFLLLSFVVYALQAQIKDPVKFKTELTALSDTEAEVVFTATMDKGWHVYSTDLGDGGPISATFNVDNKSGVELVGKLKPVGKEVSTFDKLFEMKVPISRIQQSLCRSKIHGWSLRNRRLSGIWSL